MYEEQMTGKRKANIRHYVKGGLAVMWYRTGLMHSLSEISRFLERSHCIFLTYHRVIPGKRINKYFSERSILLSIETFRKQVAFLKRHYDVLSIDEFISILKDGRSFKSHSCVVTFDDGWRDVYLHAFPLLKEYSVPATIFVATKNVDSGKGFWPEAVTRAVLRSNCESDETYRMFHVLFPNIQLPKGPLSVKRMHILAGEIIRNMKSLPMKEIEGLLSSMRNFRNPLESTSEKQRSVCSWDELKEMADTGLVTIGSHTKSHAILTNETAERSREEISESKKLIENRLGVPVRHFSYPNGNFNPGIEELVRSAGYESACTCTNGINHCGTSPFRIKRIHVNDPQLIGDGDYSDSNFALINSRWWQKVSGIRRKLGNPFWSI